MARFSDVERDLPVEFVRESGVRFASELEIVEGLIIAWSSTERSKSVAV